MCIRDRAQPGRTVEKARTFLAQVQRAWKNYMNISCTVEMCIRDSPCSLCFPFLRHARHTRCAPQPAAPNIVFHGGRGGLHVARDPGAFGHYVAHGFVALGVPCAQDAVDIFYAFFLARVGGSLGRKQRSCRRNMPSWERNPVSAGSWLLRTTRIKRNRPTTLPS